MTWLTLYSNESTLPVAASWQGDPSVLGEPTIVAGGVRVWKLNDDLRLLATLDPLVKTGIITPYHTPEMYCMNHITHYHGTPIWGDKSEVLKVAVKNGGAFVSYARPDQIRQCLEHAASVAIDNGAFSAWKRGLHINWTDFYKWLMKYYFYDNVSFIVIPDVIEGDEDDNDALIASVPSMFKDKTVPVWHLHESIDRLIRLCDSHDKICFGSSGQYATIRTKAWHARMTEAFSEMYIKRGYRTKVHGLRMLDGRIMGEYPLHTADSTNLACNVPKWKVKYPDLGSNLQHRAAILRNAVESVTPPTVEEWICSQS